MTATAETTPTLDELRTRLDEERAEADAADRDLGAAALDAKDPKRASKRVADAHAAVERTRAAIGELERREAERARHEGELAAARDRQRSYEWAADYMAGIVEVQRAQEEVRAAVDRLGEVAKGIPRPVGVVKSPGTGRPLGWDVETLDQGLIRSLPAGRMGRFRSAPSRISPTRTGPRPLISSRPGSPKPASWPSRRPRGSPSSSRPSAPDSRGSECRRGEAPLLPQGFAGGTAPLG